MNGFRIFLEVGLKGFAEGIGMGVMKAKDSRFTHGFLARAAAGAIYMAGESRRSCKFRKIRKEDVMV